MIRALLSVRFRSMFYGLTAQNRKNKKKRGIGMVILFGLLYLYLFAFLCLGMGFLFWELVTAYHALQLDWLYFAIAGLFALGLSLFGSVFSTQSQLYDAKDNDLLLSMPIPPRLILLSRMIPLLALNLLFTTVVMGPAIAVYHIRIGFAPLALAAQIVSLVGIVVLAQAIACLLGWPLHLLLSKLNKSFASMAFLVLFLVGYYFIYFQAGQIMTSLAASGESLAASLRSWVWPLYAMGLGSVGQPLPLLAFAAIAAAVFAAVYCLLSITFLSTATAQRSSRRRRKLQLSTARASSPAEAIIGNELRRFLGVPVYLMNAGLGLLLMAAVAIAGAIFSGQLLAVIRAMEWELGESITSGIPLIIFALLGFLTSTVCISTPAVSLEGKNIWILKSMPLTGKQILLSKLRFHFRLATPVAAVAALVLAACYGCTVWECLVCVLACGLHSMLCGLIGLAAGLKWAKLDYLSEAYPCKQSPSVMVTMFSVMGIPLVLVLLYYAAAVPLEPLVFLGLACLLLALLCFGFYRLIVTWGVKKWDSL